MRKSLNIPAISHVRNLLNPTQIAKYEFDRMDQLIVISRQYKKFLSDHGIAKEKIEVILNCVDLSEFQPKHISQRNQFDPFVVGLVGQH